VISFWWGLIQIYSPVATVGSLPSGDPLGNLKVDVTRQIWGQYSAVMYGLE
jgi:hypothetical protein